MHEVIGWFKERGTFGKETGFIINSVQGGDIGVGSPMVKALCKPFGDQDKCARGWVNLSG